MLGMVGPPGSGKSTLVRLLLGVYPPDAGRVLLDGQDIAHLAPVSYPPQVGVVPQEDQLFAGSVVRTSDGCGRPHARPVVAVCALRRRPRVHPPPAPGLRHGPRRARRRALAGQRQLLWIARAIVRNPRVLVLDEATSALDAGAEAHLLANIRRAGSGRTVPVVTHRPAVLEACDRVLLLEHGRVARIGTAAEVLAVRTGRQAAG